MVFRADKGSNAQQFVDISLFLVSRAAAFDIEHSPDARPVQLPKYDASGGTKGKDISQDTSFLCGHQNS